MRREDQVSVAAWANETFGRAINARIATRANEEMAELLTKLASSLPEPAKTAAVGNEIADVVVCLYRLATNLGLNVQNEVEKKMAVNRSRKWQLDGSGCGYHIP